MFALAAQGLQMGDELHMRSQATGNLLMRDLRRGSRRSGGERAARFMAGNHHFFLQPDDGRGASARRSPPRGVAGSSIVTLMSRNGTDMGIQVAGLPGRWFTGARRAGAGRAAARGLSPRPTPRSTSATRR